MPSAVRRLCAYRLLWGASFAAPVQTFFLLDRGLTFAQIMLLESVMAAAIMLAEVPTGLVSDRYGRKRSLLCGAGLSLLAMVPFLAADDFALFAASFALAGVAFTFASGSDQALIFDHLRAHGREGQMSRVFGRYGAAGVAAGALAGLLGGVLAAHRTGGEFALVYGLTIGAQVLGALVLATVPEPPREPARAARPAPLAGFVEGLRLLASDGRLRYVTALSVLTGPMTVILTYAWQPYLQSAHVPAALFGAAAAAGSLASVAANLSAHRLQRALGTERAVTVTVLAPAAVWMALAMLVHPALSVVFYAGAQGAAALRGPVFAQLTNELIPTRIRATVLSCISLLCALYLLAVRPLLGLVVQADMALGFAACAASILAGWGACLLLRRTRAVRATATQLA
jgi:MFS family permease